MYFIGCDTVSCFSGIGKKTAMKVLLSRINNLMDLNEFGETPSLDLDSLNVVAAIRFVCLLYDNKCSSEDVNGLRYRLFTKKGLLSDKLPPTLDALVLHLRRANYQCYIWKNSSTLHLNVQSPVENGWVIKEDNLVLEMMLNASVPESLAVFARCSCRKGCSTNACSCRKEKLPCTDACLCDQECSCENQFVDNYDDLSEDDDQ